MDQIGINEATKNKLFKKLNKQSGRFGIDRRKCCTPSVFHDVHCKRLSDLLISYTAISMMPISRFLRALFELLIVDCNESIQRSQLE